MTRPKFYFLITCEVLLILLVFSAASLVYGQLPDTVTTDQLKRIQFPDRIYWDENGRRESTRLYNLTPERLQWVTRQLKFTRPVNSVNNDRTLGTGFEWAETWGHAVTQAEQEDKLIYLLHLSGNLERDGYT
jgi:hypothetical protein